MAQFSFVHADLDGEGRRWRLMAETLKLELTTPAADPVTDLHITFSNSKDFTVVNVHPGPFKIGGFVQEGTEATATVGPNTLPVNTPVKVEIDIDSPENDFKLLSAAWSRGKEDTPIAGIQPTDLKATATGDPVTVFNIANDSDGFETFTNLRFLANSVQIPFEDDIGATPGFTSFLSSLTLAPHTVSSDLLSVTLDPSLFLYVEGTSFASDSSGAPLAESYQFQFGHQSPAPEPSAALLLISGIVGLAGWRLRKRSGTALSHRGSMV
jgi:hypothetical protein